MKPFRLGLAVLLASSTLAAGAVGDAADSSSRTGVTVEGDRINIAAGSLVRTLDINGNRIATAEMQVNGQQVISASFSDFHVTFHQADPNERPVGLKPDDMPPIHFPKLYRNWQRLTRNIPKDKVKLDVPTTSPQAVRWIEPIEIDGNSMADLFQIEEKAVSTPRPGVTRLNVRARVLDEAHPLYHVSVDLIYEVYDGFPVIRKWIEVTNNGPNWMKIDQLVIDPITFSQDFRTSVPLTPTENNAVSSVIAFGNSDMSQGLIAASEIPSSLRSIKGTGAMGYEEKYFEWVLGPAERFRTEPVFYFAFAGEVEKTSSSVSTPLARAVERPYMKFLEQKVGLRAKTKDLPAPVWCSWANFRHGIDDAEVREQVDYAAKAGFKTLLIDDGWSTPMLGNTEPVQAKFPDFKDTSRYVASKGLRLGVWLSCMRHPDSQDLQALPEAVSTPLNRRGGGVGMSFTSPWRDYFANDLVYLHDHFGVTYVKEDFSQVMFGDITEGHESRTRKESLLRGLRGLLKANELVGERAPALVTQITHEIYWATPGPACDLAALKYCSSYHIPPNSHLGNPDSGKRIAEVENANPKKLRRDLIEGCWLARQVYWAHRGLPLYPIEFYSAATVNYKGSLTPAVQDRQVCSWLMGTLAVFAGDMASLTPENLEHYRKRFETVERLQETYDIYRYFQYSGVPEPTDTAWHWWGKLNPEGYGAVVVLRGSAGDDSREINIPWVVPERSYDVTLLLEEKKLGTFTGEQLRSGALSLALPVYGQELLELAPAGE